MFGSELGERVVKNHNGVDVEFTEYFFLTLEIDLTTFDIDFSKAIKVYTQAQKQRNLKALMDAYERKISLN